MKYMKNILVVLILLGIIVLIPSVRALALLEPISQDLTYSDAVDLGFAAPGEEFLISFLLDTMDNYDIIDVIDSQRKDVIIENTKKTNESIFTTIRLGENLSENYTLYLVLSGKETSKTITLNMKVTDDVIYTIMQPYDRQTKYGEEKEIGYKIINKSICTKTIFVSSNLSDYWFVNGNKRLETFTLQPNSTTDISYKFNPKEIGKKEFELKLYTKYTTGSIFTEQTSKYKSYLINIDVIKNIRGVYGSLDHVYPLFNTNIMPVYFFNKLIKWII